MTLYEYRECNKGVKIIDQKHSVEGKHPEWMTVSNLLESCHVTFLLDPSQTAAPRRQGISPPPAACSMPSLDFKSEEGVHVEEHHSRRLYLRGLTTLFTFSATVISVATGSHSHAIDCDHLRSQKTKDLMNPHSIWNSFLFHHHTRQYDCNVGRYACF